MSLLHRLLRHRILRVWLAGVLALAAGSALAQEQEAGAIARLSGKASITSADNASREAAVNDKVNTGDVILTTEGSEVLVRFKDNSSLIVRSASRVKVSSFRFEKKPTDSVSTSLLAGTLRAVTGQIGKAQPSSVKFDAGAATIGIRGTDIELSIVVEGAQDRAGIYNFVHSGETLMSLDTGEELEVAKDLTGFSPAVLQPGEPRLQLLRDRPAFLQIGGFDALMQQLTAPRIPMIR